VSVNVEIFTGVLKVYPVLEEVRLFFDEAHGFFNE